MKRYLVGVLLCLATLLCLSTPAQARERAWGKCWSNTAPANQFISNSCTVTVYLTGTTTLASLYSDNIGTVKANPFGAANGTGVWFFYADNGRYDVRISAGTPGISPPYTIADILLADGGGGGGGCSIVNSSTTQVIFNLNDVCTGDPLLTWDSTNKRLLSGYPSTSFDAYTQAQYLFAGTLGSIQANLLNTSTVTGLTNFVASNVVIEDHGPNGKQDVGQMVSVVGFQATDQASSGLQGSASSVSVNGTGGVAIALGAQSGTFHESSGTTAKMVGFQSNSDVNAGTVTDLRSFESFPGTTTTGILTNLYHYYARIPFSSGGTHPVNAYGFYADTQTGSTTSSYNFYSADAGSGSADWAYYSAGGRNHLGSIAGDPASGLTNGDYWYNTSLEKFRCRENGATVNCIGSGTGGLTTKVCMMRSGSDNGTALADADIAPQTFQCKIPDDATLIEIDVHADDGTPTVIVAKVDSTGGSSVDLTSSTLATAASGGEACSNGSGGLGIDGVTTCSATLQNTTFNPGDYLQTRTATSGGVAVLHVISVVFTAPGGGGGTGDVEGPAMNTDSYVPQWDGTNTNILKNGLAALATNTAGALVLRDGSGNFAAGTITASLTGNVSGNVTGSVTGNVTGNLTGNVTGDVTGDVVGDVSNVGTLNLGVSMTPEIVITAGNIKFNGDLDLDPSTLTIRGATSGAVTIKVTPIATTFDLTVQPMGANSYFASWLASLTPVNGHCAQWVVAGAATYLGDVACPGGGGSGDVVGPATNTDSFVPQWNGANSKILKNGYTAVSTATATSLVLRDGSGNFAATTITAALTGNVTGNVTGNLTGNVTGNTSGTAGSMLFSGLTSATNTTAAMVCGTGCTIGATGSGAITATAIPFTGVTGTATEGQLPAATVFTDQNATFGAHVYTFAAATSIVPMVVGAGATVAANGQMAYDTTADNSLVYLGGSRIVGVFDGGATTNGDCVLVTKTVNAVRLTSSACPGAPGGTAFSDLTSATNSTATMHVGTGASLDATGSGSITATLLSSAGKTDIGLGQITSVFSAPLVLSTNTVTCPTCVTSAASLTSNQIVLGGGSQASATLGSLGTTTTVLHGNAAGAPSFGAVVAADLPAGVVYTTQAATFGAFAYNFTASTSLRVPAAAGLTSLATGAIVEDTNLQNWYVYNGASRAMGIWSTAPTNDECMKAVVAGGQFMMTTTGAACGGLPSTGSTGIVVQTGASTTVARSIAATSPIQITNPTGTGGNPTLACATCTTATSTDSFTNKTLSQEGSGNVITTVWEASVDAAGCNQTVAGPSWDLPAASFPAPACLTGTNTQQGVLDYDDAANESGQFKFVLPTNWVGNIDVDVYWLVTTGGGSNAVKVTIATACSTPAATYDTAYNAAQTVTTNVAANNIVTKSTQATVTVTGCVGGSIMHFKVGRDTTDTFTGTARYMGARITGRKTGA